MSDSEKYWELPQARIVIRDTDVGVKGAIIIEINDLPVAQLHVDEVHRRLFGIGRSETTLVLGDSRRVRWDAS